MRIGFTLPQFGAMAQQASEAARFAAAAEELGAASLWVGDRLLAPVEPSVGYGGTDRIPEVFHAVLDPFALMAVAASATRTAVIGTNVLNAPWYAPALLARSLTTIDALSGGRLLPGFGVGWSPEEYVAAGVPMRERGARLDECLDVLDAWWGPSPAAYEGRHWTLPATHVGLRPAHAPHPPVYLGGYSPAALDRTARRAAGWLPATAPGRADFDPAAVSGPLGRIREIAAAHGREPGDVDVILRVNPQGPAGVDTVVDVLRRAEREAGVGHAFVDLMYITSGVDEALDMVARILRDAPADTATAKSATDGTGTGV
ncbi:TIGR03619 family F420-dependent LLM class oxidoreductase [Streptomyces sp. DW26H14]|uniref:TIGR03619 family F420-dependent LLM class oxidoreductase n=1 Tax=Streptomyces sp. DW26H14 TaxID=3435395 RepID=UPI00403DA6BC